MIIQHNLAAMNANRQFNLTEIRRSKATEKLSSGYKINRAADNAAGLAISEKMRRQIRGLTQASANCQDGVSMVQTAEGALNEVHDMLHRMNELCIQASNDTLTYDDREAIQEEIYQISDEIDRVGASTTFNTIKLLDGLPQVKTTSVAGEVTVNGSVGSITQATDKRDAYYQMAPLQNGDIVHLPAPGEKYYQVATRAEINQYKKDWNDYRTAKTKYDNDMIQYNADKAQYDIDKAAWDADNTLFGGVEPTPPDKPDEPTAPLLRDGSESGKAELREIADVYNDIAEDLGKKNIAENADVADSVVVRYSRNANNGRFDLHYYGPLPVDLQVGTEAGQTLHFDINAVNAGTLGVYNLRISGDDGTAARESIDKIKSAIEKNSRERSNLGAIQNRLEHTINNLDNVVENTTAAESRIRDTDMASEMVRFSAANILSQAGQAILAQANQTNQGVLSLLG